MFTKLLSVVFSIIKRGIKLLGTIFEYNRTLACNVNLIRAIVYFLSILFVTTSAQAALPVSTQTAATSKLTAPSCITITISNVDSEISVVQTSVNVPVDTNFATHRVETLHMQPILASAAVAINSQTNNAASSVPAAGTCL